MANCHNILVCHDFAYSELVFDDYRPTSFLSIPGAKDVGLEFHSLSKTYSMAGCRAGFVVGNAPAIELLGRVKSNFDYGIFLPVQMAAAAALTGPQDCVRQTAAVYQRRPGYYCRRAGQNRLAYTAPQGFDVCLGPGA